MTGKEKQKELVKTYLKPLLKSCGYNTSGQTWWKDKGNFFTLINLQNFSWNNKDNVDFCFVIGPVLKGAMKDFNRKKPTNYDLSVPLREDFYLPSNREEHKFRSKTGYKISGETNLVDFITEIKLDFENYILPFLDKLNSLEDCIKSFGEITFWGDHLKKVIKENNLL